MHGFDSNINFSKLIARHYNEGNYSKALEYCHKAVSEYPELADFYKFNIKILEKKLLKVEGNKPKSPQAEKKPKTPQVNTIETEVAVSPVIFNVNDIENKKALATPDTTGNKIVLIRIIGNDLPGLHSNEQALSNLEFILKYEKTTDVDTIYILNRIVSEHKKAEITSLLSKHSAAYVDVPFLHEEFLNITLDFSDIPQPEFWNGRELSEWEALCVEVAKRKKRNAYLMHNNGARNLAVELGIELGYDWIMPFDGNCFVSMPQLLQLKESMRKASEKVKYLIVPMERCIENKPELCNQEPTSAKEEPQVCFHKSASLRFDYKRVYGNQPKVELFKRMGVPGLWDKWVHEYPWKRFEVNACLDTDTENWEYSSSVFKLSAGNSLVANDINKYKNERSKAIASFIDNVYSFSLKKKYNRSLIDYSYYEKCTINESSRSGDLIDLNTYFDKIFVVNMVSAKEKKLKIAKALNDYGIEFEFFEAVNGYSSENLKAYEEYASRPIGKMNYFHNYSELEKKINRKFISSPGAYGYILSYLKVLKKAKKLGLKRILILEDDVLLCHNFLSRASKFLSSIPSEWKILNLGCSQYGWQDFNDKKSLARGYYLPSMETKNSTQGSFAIALDLSVYDELIFNLEQFDSAFDVIPIGVLYEKYMGQCFNAYPYLVMPDVSRSEIRGGREQYNHANRVRWWVGDFNYPARKLTVGILLTSIQNIKYINDLSYVRDWVVDISFYIHTQNGILPVHDLNNISVLFQKSQSEQVNCLNDLNVSVDFLFEADKDCFLTEELIVETVTESMLGHFPSVELKQIYLENNVVKDRVSVIIPTYKRPDNLRATIESVLQQDYSDVEILVVDDNGVDSEFKSETRKVVIEATESAVNKKIKYLEHKINANGATARNTGILSSTGEYICFLDDDDIYLPGRISASVELLKNVGSAVSAVYCGFYGWNSTTLDLSRFSEGDLTKEILLLDYKKHYMCTNTMTYRREALFRIGGFDMSYKRHQDLELNLRFFRVYKVAALSEYLVRLAPQISGVDNKLYGKSFLELKKKFLRQFEYIINEYGEKDRREMFYRHWSEVKRYYNGDNNFEECLERDYAGGVLESYM